MGREWHESCLARCRNSKLQDRGSPAWRVQHLPLGGAQDLGIRAQSQVWLLEVERGEKTAVARWGRGLGSVPD